MIATNTIFCKIDDQLIKIIDEISKGRQIVDCGAGMGLLGSKMKNRVLSIDVYPPENALSKVHRFNCEEFTFNENQMPVFIRPCHSSFPARTIENNKELFADCIYISKPKNFVYDMGRPITEFESVKSLGWTGEDGELAFHVIINSSKIPKRRLTQWYFVKIPEFEHPVWRQKIDRYGRTDWVNSMGGGRPVFDDDEIIETCHMDNYCQLDHSKTYLGHLPEDPFNGWLSREGVFYQSAYNSHEDTADLIIGKPSRELEDLGFIKIQKAAGDKKPFVYLRNRLGSNIQRKPSQAQLAWLKKNEIPHHLDLL